MMLVAVACSRENTPPPTATTTATRIISLDFCADQYLLALADKQAIAGLSVDATKSFSYLREEAKGFPQIRPRAEDILLQKPDAVIRTYGGGPRIGEFLERTGINVIQIDYANDLAGIRSNILKTATALQQDARGVALVEQMDARLAAVEARKAKNDNKAILYLTSKGAVAGRGTMVDELINHAGLSNFEHKQGWGEISLEALAYKQPSMIAAGFFDGDDAQTDQWSPARHPLARRALSDADVIPIPGALTACGGWFTLDAIEAMNNADKGGGL